MRDDDLVRPIDRDMTGLPWERTLGRSNPHVAAPDGSCCLDHAKQRIFALEEANEANATKVATRDLELWRARERIATLEVEVARLMKGLEDIGQVATYPADTGYAGRDPWDVLWAIAQATCQLTGGKAHKLWEATDDNATE